MWLDMNVIVRNVLFLMENLEPVGREYFWSGQPTEGERKKGNQRELEERGSPIRRLAEKDM